MGIHNYDMNYATALRRVREIEISEKNKEFILNFLNDRMLDGMSKPRHPQTNGKNERFFGILDREFDERFEDLDDFICWYNNERLSEAIDYETPNEAYKKRL